MALRDFLTAAPYREPDVKFCTKGVMRLKGLPSMLCSAPATCPEKAALGDLSAWPGPWPLHPGSPDLDIAHSRTCIHISSLLSLHVCLPASACLCPGGCSHDLPGVVIARPRLTFTMAPQPPLCTPPLALAHLWSLGLCQEL